VAVVDRFAGRAAELAALRGCLVGARRGRLAIAAVEGEAGIGKTRLLDELAGCARADGMLTCRAAAVESAPSGPFGPLLAAVGLTGERRSG